ncbi:MAG TPA: hypothetical protein VNF02_04275 [Candidatus Limnocylindrales bacterium]|nr:hypothetical protein [Candidatus Limnocylindrales bacterium]
MARTRSGLMVRGVLFAGIALAIAAGSAVPAIAQTARARKSVAKFQAQFAREKKPVGQAKAVVKLGRAEYVAAWQCVTAGNFSGALEFVKDYNEHAIAAHDALDKTGVNAEKHSNGFRQLQISVRESLRQLREIAGRVPFEQRQPFQTLEKNLNALNQTLILELFPQQPGEKRHDKESKP